MSKSQSDQTNLRYSTSSQPSGQMSGILYIFFAMRRPIRPPQNSSWTAHL